MDPAKLTAHVDATWEDAIVPAISRYIRIPAKSPGFDKAWEANGHLEEAVKLIEAWCR